jgi:hypothetical protein
MREVSLATLVITLLAALSTNLCFAHATLVIGTVTVDPNPPVSNVPFKLIVTISDPILAPIEDALLKAELTSSSSKKSITIGLTESDTAGVYYGPVPLGEPGMYTLLLRDQTFRQEEATATLVFNVGTGEPIAPIAFVFPPTTTTSRTVSTWVIWLIGLPAITAILVTAFVVLSNRLPEPAK